MGATLIVFLLVSIRAPSLRGIAIKVWPLALLLFAGVGIWSAFLECPRCCQMFGTNNRYDVGGECRNCGLTLRQLASIAKPSF
jgi:hypothetical protein